MAQKLDNKSFELWQVFMYKFLFQNVPVFSNCMHTKSITQ